MPRVRQKIDAQFVAEFDEIIRWAEGLGIRRGSRFHKYRANLKWLVCHEREEERRHIYERVVAEGRTTEIISTMMESMEIVETIPALLQNGVEIPLELLKWSFSGGVDAFRETDKSNQARNSMFELRMGASAARQRLRPQFSLHNPDVSFGFEGRGVKMECKRVPSVNKVLPRIEEGIGQLAKTVDPRSDVGIVAISLSKLLNTEDRSIIDYEDPSALLAQHLSEVMKANEKVLAGLAGAYVTGVLFFISSPFYIEGKGYTIGKSGIIFPLKEREKPFIRSLAAALKV